MSTIRAREINGVFEVLSSVPGPLVVIMGGVHGNEPCGVKAIDRLTREFQEGTLSLIKGSLLLVTANEEALKANVRAVHRNLNRLFKDNSNEPDCYETRRAEALKGILADADFVLDLHSTTNPSPPFLMCEDDGLESARELGLERIVLGWASLESGALTGDTETWARRHGAKAFTLECGQHSELAAPEIAYEAARQLLRVSGLCGSACDSKMSERLVLRLYGVKLKVDEIFTFSRSFNGFDRLAAGEVIGQDSAGEHRVDRPSRIIFPIDPAKAAMGSELYLLAEEIE